MLGYQTLLLVLAWVPSILKCSSCANGRIRGWSLAGMTSLVTLSISFAMTHSLRLIGMYCLYFILFYCPLWMQFLTSASSPSSSKTSPTSRVVKVSQLLGLSTNCVSGIVPVLTTDKKRTGFQGWNSNTGSPYPRIHIRILCLIMMALSSSSSSSSSPLQFSSLRFFSWSKGKPKASVFC